MEHVISIEEFHSRKVERKEAGETSRGHDQPVIVASATEKLNITVQEKGSNSSVEEKFKKLREAAIKRQNQATTKPKIRKVVLLRDHKNFKSYCEPRVVSFGPIHHDEKKYRLTEEYKLVLADDFIKNSGNRGEDLYEMVKNNIKHLREYYDEEVTEKYNDEAIAWILFVDGCATLQFIDAVVNKKELKSVGIHLKRNNSSCLGHISFTKKWNFYPGILRLPPIIVDDSTGPKFFNLIAYEMCQDFDNDFGVTSYIAFLDSLIDEAKDVMDLKKARILHNNLGSDEEVAQLFNGICTNLVPDTEIYHDVISNIQDYYNKQYKSWIAEGLHTYFSSPWTVMAFLAALFVILATGVQTVYSVLAYYKSP
uniref:Uncharacterized protein n=1 Tax=Fagus sylvatica TaxID=28930 RepID=A0A2N9IE34_FAGSY